MPVYDLSFDPRDPYYDAPGLPGVRWAVQVFTTHNLYGLDPARVELHSDGDGDGDGGGDGLRLVCEGLRWGGQQHAAPGRVEVTVTQGDDGALIWRAQAWHDEPVKVIKLLLRGLPEAALAGGWWHATSRHDEVAHPTQAQPLCWSYPLPWLTPWACAGGDGDAGGASGAVCVSVRDPQVRAKRLYAHRPPYAAGQVVEVICEEDAMRWDGHFAAPEMRLRLCRDAAEVDRDFEAHLAYVEEAYGLRPWESRPDVPDWLRDVRLLLNLHGQHWTGYVFNTFDRMAEALRFVARHIPGERVLAYVPGWEGRYYYAYPQYQPGPAMGGPEAFGRLCATARQLGVHLMPMFGANGVNVQRYPDWERAVFRNNTDRYASLINCPDWDADRAGEGDQLFLNPGEPRWRAHLVGQVDALVRAYDLDSVYLDTTAFWFNDPRHNLYDGYRALLGELRARHPGLMIAGEGWWDAYMALFPINLSWMGVDRTYRYPQLLTRYGRALGHLAGGAPGQGSTGVFEAGFNPISPVETTPGHLPSLSIVDDTLPEHADDVARFCRAASDGSQP